ncbi:hypothetical protein LOK49_LG03G01675 [Camellia lanceoleosa]|uniref:Uncharacterized protein n=1 Tax=Camellia lanceoleosa TaxID=1840588 RepID=A0ACC0IEM3_9ERIC|nr:hypothetical protein LOK49_LG03G01675 [Camellia lanceoleosa]
MSAAIVDAPLSQVLRDNDVHDDGGDDGDEEELDLIKKPMNPYLQFRSSNVGEFSESTPSEIQTNSSQPNDNAGK